MQVYKFISDFICSRVKRFNPVKKGTKIKIHLRSYDENIKSQIDIKKVGFEDSFDMQVQKFISEKRMHLIDNEEEFQSKIL